jgi:hypothetical protein
MACVQQRRGPSLKRSSNNEYKRMPTAMWTLAVETYAPDSVSVTCLTRRLLRPVQH